MSEAFITATGQFLPGPPVNNDDVERHIGIVSPLASRRGRLTLRQNRIRARHYAMTADGQTHHTVASMAADAIRDLLARAEIGSEAIDLLATATTQADGFAPGLASAVHGELGLPPLEVVSHQSVCASSMMAMKTAWLNVKAGERQAAIAVGTEFSSRYFRPGFYQDTAVVEDDGTVAADADFLRWTLSDGAAAALVEPRKSTHSLSLRVDWIEARSFADRFQTCMSGGMARDGEDALKPWSHYPTPFAAAAAGAFTLRQDVGALHAMLPVWVAEFMRLVDNGRIDIPKVDWFLCHFSAHSIREELTRLAVRAGCMIPEERWFTNLYDKGNVGSASLFLLIDDLVRSGRLEPGQTVLCAVPESGRCIMSFMQLEVIAP